MAHVVHESTAFVLPGSAHVKQNQGMNNYVSLSCPDYVGRGVLPAEADWDGDSSLSPG